MNLIYISIIILLMSCKLFAPDFKAGAFTMTRLHYSGGGDWYADPSSIPNLLDFVSKHTNIEVDKNENRIIDDILSQMNLTKDDWKKSLGLDGMGIS